nr:hypothetical protein BaRGS_032924 [Batillaria attramentaria]
MNACRKKPAAPLHPIPVPKKKWSLVGMDIIGPLQVTDRGNQYIVALTDHFTKFPVAKAIPCKSSEEVARFMYETICIFGAFDSLITDQGREFINFALDILTDRFNINHRISSAYHPETNGQRERDNRTLKDTLVKITDNDDWDELLPAALFAYRTSVHKSTQFSPFLALYGEQAKLPFDVTGDANEQDLNEEIMDTMKGIHEEVKNKIGENISRAQKKQKEYYDSRRAYDHGFRIGDKVLIINAARVHRMGGKMAPRFVGPYEVLVLAQTHDLHDLAEKALNFILANLSGVMVPTVLSNILYLTGGQNLDDFHCTKIVFNEVWAYDPVADSWEEKQSMMVPRYNHSAASLQGQLYVVGGRASAAGISLRGDGEVYNPLTNQWTGISPVRSISGIGNAALAALDGKLYLCGGTFSNMDRRNHLTFDWYTGAQVYDPKEDLWQELLPLEREIAQTNLRVSSGDIMAVEGFLFLMDDDVGKTHQLFNPVSNTASNLVQAHGHHRFGGWVVYQGQVFCHIAHHTQEMLTRRKRLCKNTETLEGKTVIVTGANCGIGEATALELAKRHARVILACRDVASAENSVKYIRRYTKNGDLVVRQLDLASFASIREFSRKVLAEESHIDILVNNAGVFQCPYTKTKDGFEMQMGVNHLGHFLLTNLLLDRLKKSAPSRIIVVSSALHKYGAINFDDFNSEKEYNKRKSYSNSKLANALFARELSQRLDGKGVNVYCVHPGMVATNLGRHVMSRFARKLLTPIAVLLGLKTAEEGSQTIVYCAVASELQKTTGGYFGYLKQEPWTAAASDLGVAKKLWELSEKLTGLSSPGEK